MLIERQRPRAQPVVPSSPPRLRADDGEVPVGWSPSAMMLPEARHKLEQHQRQRGLLSGAGARANEAALAQAFRRLQKQQGLPETGIPGYATVEALDLEVAQIFRGSPGTQQTSASVS